MNETVAKPGMIQMLFSSGHRPFFLFTVLSAIILMGLWLAAYGGHLALSSLWHAHEMVFGFAGAAIGGFLMAAVPNWTAQPGPKGGSLLFLFGLWLLGRLVFFSVELDFILEIWRWLELAYLPVLCGVIGRMIFKAQNTRNRIVVAILAALCLTNFLYHLGFEYASVHAGLTVIVMLATLIGGRVVPSFTENALRFRYNQDMLCPTPRWTHIALMGLIALSALFEYIDPPQQISALLATCTALVLFYRMKKWRSLQSFFDPILWILHVAYLWLPLGFLLKAVSLSTEVLSPLTALHALSVGAIGLLIVAIASRAALGHSGRALKVSPLTVCAYLVLILATLSRLFFETGWGIYLSGSLWIIGFFLLALVYVPILIGPRVDGQPG